jgi:hypothetical protein
MILKKVMRGIELLKNNKRGQVEWIFFIAMFILVIGIMVPVGGAFVRSVANGLGNTSTLSDDSKAIVNSVAGNYDSLWDNLFLFIFMGSWLGLLVAFYFVQEHPVMAVFMIIFILLFLILAPIIANIYGGFSQQGVLEVNRYPKTSFILQNYLIFGIVIALSCMAVLYAKGRIG